MFRCPRKSGRYPWENYVTLKVTEDDMEDESKEEVINRFKRKGMNIEMVAKIVGISADEVRKYYDA